jgi:hypothetical protein
LTPVLELSETIHKALYATRREWIEVVKSDFRKTSVKDVQYVKKPNVASALPDNILNAIDKLDTTAAGTRLVYEISASICTRTSAISGVPHWRPILP